VKLTKKDSLWDERLAWCRTLAILTSLFAAACGRHAIAQDVPRDMRPVADAAVSAPPNRPADSSDRAEGAAEHQFELGAGRPAYHAVGAAADMISATALLWRGSTTMRVVSSAELSAVADVAGTTARCYLREGVYRGTSTVACDVEVRAHPADGGVVNLALTVDCLTDSGAKVLFSSAESAPRTATSVSNSTPPSAVSCRLSRFAPAGFTEARRFDWVSPRRLFGALALSTTIEKFQEQRALICPLSAIPHALSRPSRDGISPLAATGVHRRSRSSGSRIRPPKRALPGNWLTDLARGSARRQRELGGVRG
jgi:hypothetical protein